MATVYRITRQHTDPSVTPRVSCVRAGQTVRCLCPVASQPVDKLAEQVEVGDEVMILLPTLDAYYPVTAVEVLSAED